MGPFLPRPRAGVTWLLLAAPALACNEYRLAGKDSDEVEHTALVDTSEPDETNADSDSTLGACAELSPVPAGPAPHERTCSALPPVDWTPTIELELDLDDLGYHYAGMPTVSVDGSSREPAIYLPVDEYRVVVVDGRSGAVTNTAKGIGGELRGVAIAGAAQGGDPWLAAMAVESGADNQDCALDLVAGMGSAPARVHKLSNYLVPGVADLDHDGEPEFLVDGAVVSHEGGLTQSLQTERWGFTAVASDLDLDGVPEILNSYGVYSPSTGEQSPWTDLVVDGYWYRHWLAAPVWTPDGLRIFGVDGFGVYTSDLTGQVQWYSGDPKAAEGLVVSDIPAIGDVTGDAYPEICAKYEHSRFVMDAQGTTLWTRLHPYLDEGGCSLADLDADGRYEVIEWGRTGLYIYRGRDAALLASIRTIGTLIIWNPPVIADVDDDGSMEIVVTGDPTGEDSFSHLYVIGAANGRWARGRPVWNQTTYDITSVRDDGTLVSFPFPAWQTYNAFRAQPAHDGDHADLVVDATDACATACEAGGTVRVAAQVSNLGSRDAPAGATVRLLTWTPELGLREVASAPLPDAVPAGVAAEGVVLDVPWEDWGEVRVLQVDGDLDDECDRVNDRVEAEAIPNPCE